MVGPAALHMREHSIAMLPNWVVVLSAIELIGFFAVALGIATAVPEEALVRVGELKPGKPR